MVAGDRLLLVSSAHRLSAPPTDGPRRSAATHHAIEAGALDITRSESGAVRGVGDAEHAGGCVRPCPVVGTNDRCDCLLVLNRSRAVRRARNGDWGQAIAALVTDVWVAGARPADLGSIPCRSGYRNIPNPVRGGHAAYSGWRLMAGRVGVRGLADLQAARQRAVAWPSDWSTGSLRRGQAAAARSANRSKGGRPRTRSTVSVRRWRSAGGAQRGAGERGVARSASVSEPWRRRQATTAWIDIGSARTGPRWSLAHAPSRGVGG